MSTAEGPDRRLLLDAEGAAEGAAPDEALAPPAVVVVVVTSDPGASLDDTLASVVDQDYPGLRLVVVDAGSDDDPTGRVAGVVPSARVRRVGGSGFGEAANTALEEIDGTAFLCFCRDDVALDPSAIRLMVEEAYRSNAAIVGPKLVEFDRPDVLCDVGRAIDRFGGAHTGIERGELDQEQHDAVRDVFFVSGATMLVRADLFATLGGFDPDASPGSEDLDLCWRARLAGARVMVVPDARVRQRQADRDGAPGTRARARDVARRRIRTVFVCYSAASLLWIVPFGIGASLLEAVAFVFSRRRTDAFADARAWWWNVFHRRQSRRARRRAQELRTIHDSELRELQLGWSERLQSFLAHHRADERMGSIGDRMRAGLERLDAGARHPGTVAFAAFLAVVGLGSRALVTRGVPSIGTLVEWTGARTMAEAYGSAWRATGLGAPKPASGALAAMAALVAATLNHPGLAQTAFVLATFVAGPLGVARLVRRLGANRGPAMTAAILYGVNPVVRNAIANGRLGPLVLFALAPYLVLCFVEASGFPGLTRSVRRRRALFGLAVTTAIAVAFWPPAIAFVALVAVAFLVGSVCTGRDVVASLRGVVAALAGLVAAGVLLLPWATNFTDFGDDRAAFGFNVFLPDQRLDAVLRFHTGPAGAGIATWGIYAAAFFALVVASGPRLAWVARSWFLAAGGIAAVYVPSQLWPNAAVPAPEGALVAAALGLAVAAGLGIGAFGDELRRARFGWRQLAAVAAAVGIGLAALGFTADAIDGRWHAPTAGWNDTLSFTQDQLFAGRFRILWIGDPAVLPTDPFEVRDGIAYALTLNGAGDARAIVRAPEQAADAVARDAVALALDGQTNRLGRLVGPMGVRYIAAPGRNGPHGPKGRPIPGLRTRLADQLDLAQLRVARGLVLYENAAWIPARAVAGSDADVPVDDVRPIPAALATDLSGDVRPLRDAPARPGTVLLAQAYDEHWEATVGGRTLRHARSFGWANAFTLRRTGSVELRDTAQHRTDVRVAGQAVVWLIVVLLAWRGRNRTRRVRAGAEPLTRAERRGRAERRSAARTAARDRVRRDELDDELDDDFWSTFS